MPRLLNMGVMATMMALTLVGCGHGCRPAGRPELTPVTGILTLDGEPLHGVSFTLVPVNDTPGVGGQAHSGPDGSFKVIYARDADDGVAPGNYLVRFEKETTVPISDVAKKAILKPVPITVPPGGGLININVLSPKPGKKSAKQAPDND